MDNKLEVYRIEDERKMGPYHLIGESNVNWQDREKDWTITPCPNDEQWNNETAEKIAFRMYFNPSTHEFKHVKFAFKSIEKLQYWFSKDELQRLKELKFRIVAVVVPEAFYSRTQAMFVEENQERRVIDWDYVINGYSYSSERRNK